MKAVVFSPSASRASLELVDLPDPQPGPDEILIQIQAAGVGRWDEYYRSHAKDFVQSSDSPLILGWEGSGFVRRCGEQVRRFKPGDRVYFFDYPSDQRHEGAWAERVCVPEAVVAVMPDTMDFRQAGGFPIAALTAYQGLKEQVEIHRGQTLLVTAASGGVGSCAVAMAHELGVKVIAVASSINHDYLKNLGAEETWDYHHDFASEILRKYPGGVDAVLNCTDAPETMNTALRALKTGGCFATTIGEPDPALVQDKAVLSYFVRPDGKQLEEISNWVDRTRLGLPVQEVYPLERSQEALDRVVRGHVRGKIVLETQGIQARIH